MSLPLVSVIFSLADCKQDYSFALDSLLNQTYKNLEIIIIHSSLDEKNKKIIDSFYTKCLNKENYKCLVIEENLKKEVDRLNRGMHFSNGQYITFLTPSDYYHPERITILVENAINHHLNFIFTRVHAFDLNHRSLSFTNSWKEWYERTIFNCINMPTIECMFLNDNIAITHGNLFFSKNILSTVNKFNSFNRNFCLDFILRTIKTHTISFINENLYFYSISEKNSDNAEVDSIENELKAIYSNYLLDVIQNEPANPNAPSYKNWQLPLTKLLHSRYVNLVLSNYILKSKNPSKDELLSKINFLGRSSKKIHKIRKITLVTHDLTLGGGAPKLVLDLSKYLLKNGFQVSLISMVDGPLKNEFLKLNIPVSIFPKRLLKWSRQVGKIPRFIYLLAANIYLNCKTSTHIIFNSSASWPLALPLASFSLKKMDWYIHESFSPIIYLKTGIYKKLLQKAIKARKFSFWFGSNSTKKIWESSLSVTGKTLYWSGLNQSVHQSKKSKKIKNLLAIGTSSERKGFHFLVDAFISLIENKEISEDVNLTMIGFPQKIDFFNASIILKILSANLMHRIKLVSCVNASEIDEYYKQADLFVQPSILECMPLSLLQAMALNIPVVSTNVQGCSEAIIENQTGYLCAPSNVESLKNALLKAINNPKTTHLYAQNAQMYFNQKFSLDITLPSILSNIQLAPKSFFYKIKEFIYKKTRTNELFE